MAMISKAKGPKCANTPALGRPPDANAPSLPPLQEWLFLRGPRYFIRLRMRPTSTPASTCPMTESRKSAIGNTSSIGEDLSPHRHTTRRGRAVQSTYRPAAIFFVF